MRVLTNRKIRRAVLALRTGPLCSKYGAVILRNFCLIRFRRLFTYPVPGFLPVKHRQHRINFVRSSLYYFFSYTNKFGQFCTCMHIAQHRTSHISIELRNHIREIVLFHTCTYIYLTRSKFAPWRRQNLSFGSDFRFGLHAQRYFRFGLCGKPVRQL